MAQPSILEMPGSPGGYSPSSAISRPPWQRAEPGLAGQCCPAGTGRTGLPSSPGGAAGRSEPTWLQSERHHVAGTKALCAPTVLDTRESTRPGGENPSAGAAHPLATARASLETATALPWVPLSILTHMFTRQPKASREGSPFPVEARQPGEGELPILGYPWSHSPVSGSPDPHFEMGWGVDPAGVTQRATRRRTARKNHPAPSDFSFLLLLRAAPAPLANRRVAAPLFRIYTPKPKFRDAKPDCHAQAGNKAPPPVQDQAGLTGAAAWLPPSCSDDAQPQIRCHPRGKQTSPDSHPRRCQWSQPLPWFPLEPVPRCKQGLKASQSRGLPPKPGCSPRYPSQGKDAASRDAVTSSPRNHST